MDCYLCGATNSPEDDYCRQCNGQLLKAAPDDLDDVPGGLELPPLTLPPIEPPPVAETPPPVPMVESVDDFDDAADLDADLAPPPLPGQQTITPETSAAPETSTPEPAAVTEPDIAPPPLPLAEVSPDSTTDNGFGEFADFGGGIDFGVDPDEAHATLADDDDATEDDENLASLASVEHAALSSALGLGDDGDAPKKGKLRVPTARPTSKMPELGTSRGDKTIHAEGMREAPVGRAAYALLGVLALAVGWLAYATFTHKPSAPDTIAFQGSTTTIASTSTTEAIARPWSADEIEGRHGDSFVRVILYACPTIPGSESDERNVEPIAEHVTVGIAVNRTNVVMSTAELPSANVATIRSRTGATTLARVNQLTGDAAAATPIREINRNLQLVEIETDAASWWLHHDIDLEVNATFVTESPTENSLEVGVDAYGEVVDLRVAGSTLDAEELRQLEFATEASESDDARGAKTVCDQANFLLDATPTAETETLDGGTDDDPDTTTEDGS